MEVLYVSFYLCKLNLLFSLSVLFVAVAAFGFSQAKREVGLKGDVNLASLKDSDVDGDNFTAFHGGVYALNELPRSKLTGYLGITILKQF